MDILIDYICISRLPNAYPNVVPSESDTTCSDVDAIEEEVYTDELHTLVDHGIRDLIIGFDAPMYNGINNIKHDDLSPFFKIMNFIITNNIYPCQHKTKVGIDQTKFMFESHAAFLST